ncbi:MAG: RlmE family RNA methyltransferase [Candidatus Peribacteraceae bacterium]|nr:RlmE family RNA methyltransferase [Candidatus Peribacteraceae bacterium]
MPKAYVPNDKWSRRASEEGYRARSVYKLMELDERFRLLKKGMRVLDLGASPGSWLQYAAAQVGTKGTVLGIDLKEIEPVARHVATEVADITDATQVEKILAAHGLPEIDLVLSDLAPNTSGIKDIDQWRSIELSQAVSAIAQHALKPGGTCVMKILRGADFDPFLAEAKRSWDSVRTAQVEASRDRSREIYVVMQKR